MQDEFFDSSAVNAQTPVPQPQIETPKEIPWGKIALIAGAFYYLIGGTFFGLKLVKGAKGKAF